LRKRPTLSRLTDAVHSLAILFRYSSQNSWASLAKASHAFSLAKTMTAGLFRQMIQD